LTALYKRFLLKEGRMVLELVPDRTTYPLTNTYSVANLASTFPVKYILDQDEPFMNDLLKVERIYTNAQFEMKLNDLSDEYSLMMRAYNLLYVPLPVVNRTNEVPCDLKTPTLEIFYRAAHPVIPIGVDPCVTVLELPDSHNEALLYFVASRLMMPTGVGQLEGYGGNMWFQRYEAECARLEQQAMYVHRDAQNTRLVANGWA
jgi:hypothetical protein